MTRPAWTADDIGRTGPATMPVQYTPSEPAEAATELGADDTRDDAFAFPRGAINALAITVACVALALWLATLWGAR